MGKIMLAVTACICTASCTTIATHPVNDLSSVPDGVRVYAPKVYLLVDKLQHKSTIVNLPNYGRAYDVKPLTVFARQDFNMQMDVGQVTQLTSNQDTTAFLSFFTQAAQIGVKAGGLPAAVTTMDGDFGLDSGVYTLADDGTWQRVNVR